MKNLLVVTVAILFIGCSSKEIQTELHHNNERFFFKRYRDCNKASKCLSLPSCPLKGSEVSDCYVAESQENVQEPEKFCKIPMIIAEGDSWFQYPQPIQGILGQPQDLLSHIRQSKLHVDDDGKSGHPAVLAFSTFGDEFGGMLLQRQTRKWFISCDSNGRKLKNKYEFDAFLLSAGGNDLLDSRTFADLLRVNPGVKFDEQRPERHIDSVFLNRRFKEIKHQLETLAYLVRNQSSNKEIKIYIHGYDYIQITPDEKSCTSIWKTFSVCEWIRPIFVQKGYSNIDNKSRNQIVRYILDQFNDEVLAKLADPNTPATIDTRQGSKKRAAFVHVDLRGSLKNLSDWQDEIHPSSKASCILANKFIVKLNADLKSRGKVGIELNKCE